MLRYYLNTVLMKAYVGNPEYFYFLLFVLSTPTI